MCSYKNNRFISGVMLMITIMFSFVISLIMSNSQLIKAEGDVEGDVYITFYSLNVTYKPMDVSNLEVTIYVAIDSSTHVSWYGDDGNLFTQDGYYNVSESLSESGEIWLKAGTYGVSLWDAYQVVGEPGYKFHILQMTIYVIEGETAGDSYIRFNNLNKTIYAVDYATAAKTIDIWLDGNSKASISWIADDGGLFDKSTGKTLYNFNDTTGASLPQGTYGVSLWDKYLVAGESGYKCYILELTINVHSMVIGDAWFDITDNDYNYGTTIYANDSSNDGAEFLFQVVMNDTLNVSWNADSGYIASTDGGIGYYFDEIPSGTASLPIGTYEVGLWDVYTSAGTEKYCFNIVNFIIYIEEAATEDEGNAFITFHDLNKTIYAYDSAINGEEISILVSFGSSASITYSGDDGVIFVEETGNIVYDLESSGTGTLKPGRYGVSLWDAFTIKGETKYRFHILSFTIIVEEKVTLGTITSIEQSYLSPPSYDVYNDAYFMFMITGEKYNARDTYASSEIVKTVGDESETVMLEFVRDDGAICSLGYCPIGGHGADLISLSIGDYTLYLVDLSLVENGSVGSPTVVFTIHIILKEEVKDDSFIDLYCYGNNTYFRLSSYYYANDAYITLGVSSSSDTMKLFYDVDYLVFISSSTSISYMHSTGEMSLTSGSYTITIIDYDNTGAIYAEGTIYLNIIVVNGTIASGTSGIYSDGYYWNKKGTYPAIIPTNGRESAELILRHSSSGYISGNSNDGTYYYVFLKGKYYSTYDLPIGSYEIYVKDLDGSTIYLSELTIRNITVKVSSEFQYGFAGKNAYSCLAEGKYECTYETSFMIDYGLSGGGYIVYDTATINYTFNGVTSTIYNATTSGEYLFYMTEGKYEIIIKDQYVTLTILMYVDYMIHGYISITGGNTYSSSACLESVTDSVVCYYNEKIYLDSKLAEEGIEVYILTQFYSISPDASSIDSLGNYELYAYFKAGEYEIYIEDGFSMIYLTLTIELLDSIAPVVSVTFEYDTTQYAKITEPVISVTDESNITMYYCFSTSTTCDYWSSTTSKNVSIPKYLTGTYYFVVYAVDTYGNASDTQTFSVLGDYTKPYLNMEATETEVASHNIDFVNGTVSFMFTPADDHSGANLSEVSIYGGSYSNNVITLPITSFVSGSLTYYFDLEDNVGNVLSSSAVISVSNQLNDVLVGQIMKGLRQQKLNMNLVNLSYHTKSLKYTLDSNLTDLTALTYLSYLGIDLLSNLKLSYIYVNDQNNLLSNSSSVLSAYKSIARSIDVESLSDEIVSPVGLNPGISSLVLFVQIDGFSESVPVLVGKGEILASSVTLLNSFDTYESAEVSYLGAGLGSDGTVVSFSDDSETSMAVTLGASNKIEKRDVYGNLEWERAITSSGKVTLKKVINNEYGILVLGETTSGNINGKQYPLKGGNDILVIKLDQEGNILYTNVVGTTVSDYVVNGDMDDNTIAIVTSKVDNELTTGTLITIDTNSNNVKLHTINSATSTYLSSVAIRGNKVAIAGSTTSSVIAIDNVERIIGNIGSKDAFVSLFEDDKLSWTRRLGGTGVDEFYSLILDDSNIYVVGQSDNSVLYDSLGQTKMLSNNGSKDGLIIKYDMYGNIVQTSSIGGNGDDTFTEIIINNDKLIIAGLSSSDSITASAYGNLGFTINRLGEVDTLIVTLDKSLVIQSGMNLSGEEGQLVQDIGINQYTEQLMILSGNAVYTQKVIDSTLKYEVHVENGMLRVDANEEIKSAKLYTGSASYDIGEGIEVVEGAYEIEVTSANGEVIRKVIYVDDSMVEVSRNNINPLPIIISASSVIILGFVALFIIKRRKALLEA